MFSFVKYCIVLYAITDIFDGMVSCIGYRYIAQHIWYCSFIKASSLHLHAINYFVFLPLKYDLVVTSYVPIVLNITSHCWNIATGNITIAISKLHCTKQQCY